MVASKKVSYKFLLIFLVLPLLLYTILIIYPMISVWFYSLTKWNAITKPKYIGLGNFLRLFQDVDNILVLKNTGRLILYSLFIQIPIALIMSYGLSILHSKFSSVLRTLFFFPVIISPIAIGVMFTQVYNAEFGLLNQFLSMLNPNWGNHSWLTDKKTVLNAVVFPDVWRYIGYYIVIFYAGISGVPRTLTESARIDGANRFSIFSRIHLPLMMDVIEVSFILSLSGSFRSFAVPLSITEGGPGKYSSIAALYMYQTSFIKRELGYGSSIAIEIIVLALLSIVVSRRILKHESYQY